jgi:hypothetical protein
VLCAVLGDLFVAVLTRPPVSRSTAPGTTAGLAGPAEPDKLAPVRRLALAALAAAESNGRTGIIHIADVAWQAALTERADLAAVLLDRHRDAWATLGPNAGPVAHAVLAFL